jgi:hypothetical protein
MRGFTPPVTRVARQEAAYWVGRHNDDSPMPDRTFAGKIEAADRTWSVLGIEALGLDKLRLLT